MTSSDDDVFTIELQDSRDVKMHFEVETSAHLEPVFNKYSQFKGMTLDSLQFTYKDKTILPDASPASLGMSDVDNTINVLLTGQALTKETIAQACMAGSTSTVVDLLSENNGLCSASLTWFDSDGQELSTPPIFICIDYGHSELVGKLLPLHKDILNTLKEGDGDYSPLQWASWTGSLDIVKILLKGGASADEEALSLAREHGHTIVAEHLLNNVDLYSGLEGDTDAIMEKACREGDADMVRKLLERESDNIEKWRDEDGIYMYLAVKNGHVDVIQLFAERGVQRDSTDAVPEVSAE